MNILIADDHLVVRKGLIQIIGDEFPLASIYDVGTGESALNQLRTGSYDIAILDLNMPDMNGLEVVKLAQAEAISTPLLVLTSLPEDQYALRVLKAGAAGFIGKETAGEELCKAIRKILNKRKYITESLSERMADSLSLHPSKALHEQLSDREFQIMKLLAAGKTVSEIASQLSLAIPTVSTYRSRVLDKMNMSNNSELIRYILNTRIS
jgi:two-component system invasion response regulator UvrY